MNFSNWIARAEGFADGVSAVLRKLTPIVTDARKLLHACNGFVAEFDKARKK
ncbi:hypothetical protein [Streptomyces sp. PLM4]|uniref:hypothetical protein n=1 Tax=Streptomyces sp. PLM4 TaxID=2929798 RepID=UPI0020595F68|nr:hypothetical protein [Streptomyces sp. PLM4]BDH67011.1 hypothetical protein MTP06_04600 [Streptomyces sp. PLM4]